MNSEFAFIISNRQPELAFIEVAPGGWKTYEMVLRYVHLASEYLTDATSRIETPLDASRTALYYFSTLEKQKAHTEM